MLHIRPSALACGVIREQEEVDRLRNIFHHSCPSHFFRRLISTNEREIIEFFRAETDTDTFI